MTRTATSPPWWSRLPRFLRPPRPVFIRRPVSATRTRAGWVLLAVVVGALGVFQWATSDERIRERARRFLESATHGEVEVDSARFSMFDGITLRGVRIATPARPGSAETADSRRIFSAESVTLYPKPWKLPLLKLDVSEIAAVRPEFYIVQDMSSGQFNWEQLRSPAVLGERRTTPVRPRVRLRDAELHTATIDPSGQRTTGLIVLDVDVSPRQDSATGYVVDIRKHSDKPNRGRMMYDPQTGSISDTPVIGLGSVRPLLPKQAQAFFDRIGLEGEISSRSIRYGTTTQPARHFELSLDDVSLSLPYSMLGSGHSESAAEARQRGVPLIQLTGIKGGVTVSDASIDVALAGRLNDVPCELKGRLAEYSESLEKVGLDLEFSLTGLMMPEGEARARLLADESTPFEIRDFLLQYDPYGPLDMRGKLVRRAGGGDLEFIGDLVARCRVARFREFPYPIDGATGNVRFRPDGEWIDGISGHRGPASIRIDGHVDNMHLWTGYDILVTATALPLNAELYNLLEPGYRRLWRRFDLRGLLNAEIRVSRPNGDAQTGSRRFRTAVGIDLCDAHVKFDQFPYPLEGVRGKLNVEAGVIRIDGLIGRSAAAGDESRHAIVRVDGYYQDERPLDPASVGNLELRLEAKDLKIERRLTDSLPTDAREALEQLRASGWIDVAGRVFTDDAAGTLKYDLDAEVRDAAICYAELPYAIDGLRGRMRISPDRLTLIELAGSHGRAMFGAQGEVRQTADGFDADLRLSVAKLALDDELRRAVSGQLKELWELLSPSGILDLRTTLHRRRRGDQVSIEHATTIDLQGASMRYRDFPLAMRDLRGTVRATEREVALEGISGRCGQGEVTLGGKVVLEEGRPRGSLAVRCENMKFDEAFLAALPTAIRDGVRAMALRGGFSLKLGEFLFRPGEGGRTEYSWNGELSLRDAAMSLGLDVRDVTGSLSVDRGTYGARGIGLHGNGSMARAVFGQFDLRNLRFDAEMKSGTNVLELTDARAELFGGSVSGSCTVTLLPDDTKYELSVELRDAELHRYLQATRRIGEAQTARGLLYGKFSMRGLTSRPNERRGGGELFLREAQVWKLPLMLKIFQLLNLAPDENMFHDGWLKFFIEGNTMHMTKIDLQGGAISLIGSGELNIENDEINIRLLAGSPHRLRVPIVTEMIEGASRDLFELHITGSLRDPKIETQQARNIRRALETIFPPPANRGGDR